MKVVLSHTGTGSFVEQVALAFHERGMLAAFNTTIVPDPNSKFQSAAKRLAGIAGVDLGAQLERRRIHQIPAGLVRCHARWEWLRLLSGRLDRSGVVTDLVWELGEKRFSRWAAGHGIDAADAVYGYEHASLEVFRAAKQRGMKCILDIPAPHASYVDSLVAREIERFPELDTAHRRRIARLRPRRDARVAEELALADVVVTNSEFTRQTFVDAGEDGAKMHVVPLGCPPVREAVGQRSGDSAVGPLKVLWAGAFSLRKGAHYALAAWRRWNPGKAAELVIYGHNRLPKSELDELPSNVHFRGTVPHRELLTICEQSDLLLFPTLCDGFGLVISEALASGLPVLTTRRAGASHLVEHESNGILVEPESTESLVEGMQWFLDHRSRLSEMRAAAVRAAASWQWSNYRKLLIETVLAGMTPSQVPAPLKAAV